MNFEKCQQSQTEANDFLYIMKKLTFFTKAVS